MSHGQGSKTSPSHLELTLPWMKRDLSPLLMVEERKQKQKILGLSTPLFVESVLSMTQGISWESPIFGEGVLHLIKKWSPVSTALL
jgi:hypothetical protein